MKLLHFALALLVALPAAAQGRGGYLTRLTEAAEALETALASADRHGPCRGAISADLRKAIRDVDDLRRGASEVALLETQLFVAEVGLKGALWQCSEAVLRAAVDAGASLRQARRLKADGRDRHDRDDRDDERRRPRPEAAGVVIGNLKVNINSSMPSQPGVAAEPAVQFTADQLQVTGLPGSEVVVSMAVRSQSGDWTGWISGPVLKLETEAASFQAIGPFFFRHGFLRTISTDGGAFVAVIQVKRSADGQELGRKELPFAVPLPPPLPLPPPPAPVARDCGTGEDPGCEMQRNGQAPMDGQTFSGLMSSIRANRSEFSRLEMVKAILNRHALTAKQLGLLMDEFRSELTKLDVAKFAVPKLVNPMHALTWSTKFRSTFNQEAYTKLIANHP